MAINEDIAAVQTAADGSWSVCTDSRRLIFLGRGARLEVPVEAPLRWVRDGRDVSFDEALAAVPEDLHRWMSLAALIALRHCLAGLVIGVALPGGYHEWEALAGRAAPISEWMLALGRLDHLGVPAVPDGVDDGLNDADGE